VAVKRSEAPQPIAPVSARGREELLGQRGTVVWLTGLSGAGKSTVARALEAMLVERGRLCVVLDGDDLRRGLNADLGFSAADRSENIRRTAAVAALFADAGLVAVTALISPFRADRERARSTIGPERFVEVFVDTPLAVCEERDPKGLYRRARRGELAEFTGISSPYEPPADPALAILTERVRADEAAAAIVRLLEEERFLPSPGSP
jgi:adenylyl-sulfate kinase